MIQSATEQRRAFGAGRPVAILWAGLLCGVLDITAASVMATLNGGGPFRVLQSISSALLGPAAFTDGFPAAALGLLMHFSVATTAAAVFYALSRKMPALVHHAIVAGLVYGAAVYFVMYWGVIPLSGLVRRLYLENVTIRFATFAWQPLLIHFTCVGLPIALTVRAFSDRRR